MNKTHPAIDLSFSPSLPKSIQSTPFDLQGISHSITINTSVCLICSLPAVVSSCCWPESLNHVKWSTFSQLFLVLNWRLGAS